MTGLILYTDPVDMDIIMTMGTERLVGMTGMMGDPLTPGCPAMGKSLIHMLTLFESR